MVENHYGKPLNESEIRIAAHVPVGGDFKDVPDEHLPEHLVFLKNSKRSERNGGQGFGFKRYDWDDAPHTITGDVTQKRTIKLHPGEKTWGCYEMAINHYGSTLKVYAEGEKQYGRHTNRPTEWGSPAPTVMFGGGNGGARPHPHPGTIEGGKEEMIYNPIPQQKPNGLTVLELFAGGGLMAAGLKSAGYDIVWANDFDKSACEAYRYNYGEHIIHGDITAVDPHTMPGVDIIAGGPPCQDFSVAGTGAGEEGDRGKLVWTYLSIIEAKQPKAFIFENVKGLVGKKHKHTFDALLEQFEQIGYKVSWVVVNAWDYGVAQKRERVFIIGIRNDLGFSYQFPEPDAELYRTQVLRDVIGDLPEPGEKKNHAPEKKLPAYIENVITGKTSTNFGQGIPINDGSTPARTVIAQYYAIGPNELHGLENHPDNHDGSLFDNVGNNPTWEHANREADLEAPAPTRTEKDRCDGINTINGRPRRFTVRECLRIQSVPDWYVLPDSISLSAQYRIVGNGVASRVSYLLGAALAEQLRAAEVVTEEDWEAMLA